MHMVPSNGTYHDVMHSLDGDIMKHMNMARLRILFGLYTVVAVCSVGVQGCKPMCSSASLAMLMHCDTFSVYIKVLG